MGHVYLATEDPLSQSVAEVLAREAGFVSMQSLRKGGFGYLRSNFSKFCNLAHTYPVVLLTDLDRKLCPARLLEDWIGQKAVPQNLLFRVVVREIESWLLADHIAMRRLFGSGVGALPRDPDELPDPKKTLLAFAASAPRRVREELLANRGAVASQGIGYNAMLSELIRTTWSSARAADRSQSLFRAKNRLQELADRVL